MKLAVFGSPISHSRSPDIHQAFAAQNGKQVDYQKILAEPNHFVTALTSFQQAGGVGANVTVPLKELAFSLCSELSERAQQAGAVNTLIYLPERNSWRGDNTDGAGLVADLQRLQVPITNARVLILGAGGAVRGVIGPLLQAGVAALHIANRTEVKAQALAIDKVTASSLLAVGGTWDVIINGTSSGLQQQRPDISPSLLANQPFCYDMVYGGQLTPFLAWAKAHSCPVADGLGMLVEQAALSYQQWTGDKPQTAPVLDLLRTKLSASQP